MGLAIISLLTGLAISAVAIYYSVAGLTAIFAAAAIPIMVMGVALEIAKLVATVWLKQNWKIAPALIKTYLVAAVGVLMFITSMGIFGFLSKAHSDQSLVSGDVQSKIAIYDQKIQTSKENIEANRKALKQMDEAVDQSMARSTDEKGADKAVAIRRSQQKERTRLLQEIQTEQTNIAKLNDEAAPIRAEVRKVEAEVGPIKYIAAFVYGDNPDQNILERAVTWVIVIIVFVFDPLAVVLLLAAQYSFARIGIGVGYEKEKEERDEEERQSRLTVAQRLSEKITGVRQYFSDSLGTLKSAFTSPLKETEPVENVPVVIQPEIEYRVLEDVDEELEQSTANILDDAKEKLAQFVNALEQQEQATQPTFAKFESDLTGFEVPKVQSAEVPQELVDTKLNVSSPEFKQEDLDIPVLENEEMWAQRVIDENPEQDIVEVVGVENWNKMLEEAEKAVEEENFQSGLVDARQDPTFKILPELVSTLNERPGDYVTDPGYVQNEEQGESTLWKSLHEGLTQEEYQHKVQENLAKENHDGKNNPDKSA